VDPETKAKELDEEGVVDAALSKLSVSDEVLFEGRACKIQDRDQQIIPKVSLDGSLQLELQCKGGKGVEVGIIHCKS
jgi:hypothetical protein